MDFNAPKLNNEEFRILNSESHTLNTSLQTTTNKKCASIIKSHFLQNKYLDYSSSCTRKSLHIYYNLPQYYCICEHVAHIFFLRRRKSISCKHITTKDPKKEISLFPATFLFLLHAPYVLWMCF